jgi:hypothetical protein
MPTELAHIEQANRNQSVLDSLLVHQDDGFPEWVATLAFYKALHIVEAVFSGAPHISHQQTHFAHDQALKRTNKYMHIAKHYAQLHRVSLIARYLCSGGEQFQRFSDYMTAEEVRTRVVNHLLLQVECSAVQFLSPKARSQLRRVDGSVA